MYLYFSWLDIAHNLLNDWKRIEASMEREKVNQEEHKKEEKVVSECSPQAPLMSKRNRSFDYSR